MNCDIEKFLGKLNTLKCKESIEFRLRFEKKWLNYRFVKSTLIEKELLELIKSYKNYHKLK